jgi:hypothetical protein
MSLASNDDATIHLLPKSGRSPPMTIDSNKGAPWWVQVAIAVLIALGGALIGRAVTYMNKTDQATIGFATLTSQFISFQQSVHDDLVSIKDQIKGYPNQQAAVADLTRRALVTDDHLHDLDARAAAGEQKIYQEQTDLRALSSTVDDLRKASGPIRNTR